jgi:hypothetical protein
LADQPDDANRALHAIMDCETFRRRLLIDPFDQDPELRAHGRGCPACAGEAERALAFEAQLRRALADEAGCAGQGSRHVRRRRLAAALLALLPLLGAGIWWLTVAGRGPAAEEVTAAALAHVRAEIRLIDGPRNALESARARPATVDILLRGLGMRDRLVLGAEAERLRYAGRCRIGDQDGLHLVLDGRRGPVTVLLMPRRALAAPVEAASERFDMLVLPAGDDAALALLGEHGEPLGDLARRLAPQR